MRADGAPKLKSVWDWNFPPPWICAVAGAVIVLIFSVVMWQVSERTSAEVKAKAAPALAPKRNDPNDPDSW